MTGFLLYNAPQSTCSQRVRCALHLKGIEFAEKRLNLLSGDQLAPQYLALNPNGVVPTLVHDGVTVIDSAVILEYLEDIAPDRTPLRPRAPRQLAQMRAMMRFIDEVPAPAIRVPTYNLAFLPHFSKMSEADFQALCDSKPLRREFLMKMGRSGFSEREMEEAEGRLRRGIVRMGSWLDESGGPWIMGAHITLADLAIMPVIIRMDDIGLGHIWSDTPQIDEWLAGIRSLGAWSATFYSGSLLTDKYPHLAKGRAQAPPSAH